MFVTHDRSFLRALATRIVEIDHGVAEAGAQLVLFELIPGKLAADISKSLTVPTIGIGAGVDCDGQVLVLHDMLNVFPGKKPKFVRNFMDNQPSIQAAVQAYVSAVKDKTFPTAEHTF